MSAFEAAAHAALAAGGDWKTGLDAMLPELAAVKPDVVFCFGAHQWSRHFPEILARVRSETGARALIGCSTTTVIANDRELERLPALALLAVALPGATLTPVRFTPDQIAAGRDVERWYDTLGVPRDHGRGWFLFGDAFQLDSAALLAQLNHAYPGAPIAGGLAAAGPRDRETWLFINDDVVSGGAVGLAIGGQYDLVPLVSQGCEPIGQTWTITGVANGWIETIGNRTAIHVLMETLNALEGDVRVRARRNLLLGVAANENQPDYQRGDFLVRAVTGFDQARGAISVDGGLRVGQTVQFQMRDAAAADLDLAATLDRASGRLDGRQPIAGVLCACQSRGANLFGTSHHDAAAVTRAFDSLAIAGCFCSAEIGSLRLVPFVQGQTAVLGMICRRNRA